MDTVGGTPSDMVAPPYLRLHCIDKDQIVLFILIFMFSNIFRLIFGSGSVGGLFPAQGLMVKGFKRLQFYVGPIKGKSQLGIKFGMIDFGRYFYVSRRASMIIIIRNIPQQQL